MEPVLVVDDQPAIRHLIRAALGDEVEVHDAADWVTATQRAAAGGWRVVILDVGIPGAPPAACMVAEVRRLAPDSAVILVTGRDDGEVRSLAGLDRVEFVAKPFDVADLRRLVRRLLTPGG